jgi:hypothetical protein
MRRRSPPFPFPIGRHPLTTGRRSPSPGPSRQGRGTIARKDRRWTVAVCVRHGVGAMANGLPPPVPTVWIQSRLRRRVPPLQRGTGRFFRRARPCRCRLHGVVYPQPCRGGVHPRPPILMEWIDTNQRLDQRAVSESHCGGPVRSRSTWSAPVRRSAA